MSIISEGKLNLVLLFSQKDTKCYEMSNLIVYWKVGKMKLHTQYMFLGTYQISDVMELRIGRGWRHIENGDRCEFGAILLECMKIYGDALRILSEV